MTIQIWFYKTRILKQKKMDNKMSINNIPKFTNTYIEKIAVYVDGAATLNPGPAGIGVVIFDDCSGIQLEQYKEFIEEGDKTVNQAEYLALIRGLEKACGHCRKTVICYSDSQLVVNQMNRRFRIRVPYLLELHLKAKSLEATFEKVRYVKSSTKQSDRLKIADRLSKQAIDEFLNK
jgi:ribonuclease HI